MQEQFTRTALILGEENIEKLSAKRVAVFGLGGVGGYVVEALARAGVGTLDLFDGDVVSINNLNRQIIATHQTLGMPKTQAAAERVKQINPHICANEHNFFVNADNIEGIDFGAFDYVADAVDDVSAKVLIALKCSQKNVKIIASMGTGNKLNPMGFKVADISRTKMCPLARVMRREYKKAGIDHLTVVYSEEPPVQIDYGEKEGERIKRVPGSLPYVPPAAGLLIAAHIVSNLC